jgi:hypothetical protein
LTNLNEIEIIAENLRQEHYVLFQNDCITKSHRLKKQCKMVGIDARVVICIGIARARWFNRWLTVPVIHGWAEIDGKRVETSRRLGSSGIWDIVPMYIKPVFCLRI